MKKRVKGNGEELQKSVQGSTQGGGEGAREKVNVYYLTPGDIEIEGALHE